MAEIFDTKPLSLYIKEEYVEEEKEEEENEIKCCKQVIQVILYREEGRGRGSELYNCLMTKKSYYLLS